MRRSLVAVAAVLVLAGCIYPEGYTGSTSALRVIDGPEDAPAGTQWTNGYLTVNAPVTLDHVWVRGGIYDQGGNLTVRESIVEGRNLWFILYTTGGTLTVEDSTLRWRDGNSVNPDPGNGAGVIQIGGTTTMTVRRSNLSGNPDGIQAAGPTLIEDTVIHHLAMSGSPPNNTHNDGIQFYAGDLTVRRTFIQTGAVFPYSNSAVFLQGAGIGNVNISDTLLDGGGYTLYAQNGRVRFCNSYYGSAHLWGQELIQAPAVKVAC